MFAITYHLFPVLVSFVPHFSALQLSHLFFSRPLVSFLFFQVANFVRTLLNKTALDNYRFTHFWYWSSLQPRILVSLTSTVNGEKFMSVWLTFLFLFLHVFLYIWLSFFLPVCLLSTNMSSSLASFPCQCLVFPPTSSGVKVIRKECTYSHWETFETMQAEDTTGKFRLFS